MIRHKSSKSNHGQPSILQLLHLEIIPRRLVRRPKLEVIHRRIISPKEGLALRFLLVLPSLEDSANQNPLGPPLGIGLEDGIDGVGGCDVLGVEGAEYFGEEPADGGEHGGAAVGKFGATGPVYGDVVAETEGVELCLISWEKRSVRS